MIKTRAIVLHRFPYSDSSWIVKALTEETGTVSFIVKGGKRKDSPFRGALDPLALCEIVYRENPNTELQFLKEASVINWHVHLRENLLALAKAQVMAEIVLRYAPAGVPLEGEFSLLEEALAALDAPDIKLPADDNSEVKLPADSEVKPPASNAPEVKPPAGNSPEQDAAPSLPAGIKQSANKSGVFARWLLDICELWGYHLDMSSCSRCDHQIEGAPADFHPETGAFVCKSCLGVETPRARPETLAGFETLRTGRAIAHPEFVENALLAYLRSHIGFMREINSLKFLNETRKLYDRSR
ncbi:DNA replication and repair protein RecO [Fibrobacter sp. UWCM]|uniref:DNA repair protein RecO n=1 Tax=Fibrobacter sp. UWCM TaxID=1896208 RepID=UPI0009170B66|nr:DNA repair protein RecO [Fibrobacter sp. UWCM]SHH13404.1 DNA replication and repair protein RecO [Fibrobacter sp. UWCM]